MGYGPMIDSLEIVEPTNGGTADANVPFGNGICEGDVKAHGFAIKRDWRIATFKVLVRPYRPSAPLTLPWTAVTTDGEDVSYGPVAGENGKYKWEKVCETTPCTGGNCENSGENLIAIAVEWEQIDETGKTIWKWEPAEADGDIVANKFTANCVFPIGRTSPKRTAFFDSNTVAKRIGDWTNYAIDVNNGSVLTDAVSHSPLRAKKIACYVREVDWLIESNPWRPVRSPLGTLKTPGTDDRPRFSNLFLGAACVVQRERITPSPSPEAHPTLVTVIDSERRKRPTIVTLDDRLDAKIVVNARPSSVLPNIGKLVICVKVLE